MSSYDVAYGTVLGMYSIFWLLIMLVCIVAEWKVFVKAGEPGWACLIPVYNVYVIFKIALGNGWLLLTLFIPLVNIYFGFKAYIALAHKFGKSTAFGVGLMLLCPVFMLILAFGGSKYTA